jgi:nicotinamidase-related amidase
VLPVVTELASRHPERTVITRFIPSGTGHRHARHVAAILLAMEGCDAPATRSRSPGAAIACQALSIDKERHPAFVEPHLSEFLHAIEADGLIVTGSETDVCVLATVLCAVDLGYRVIVVRDAVCSSSDEGHDALVTLFRQRYTEQIEVADAAAIMERWES